MINSKARLNSALNAICVTPHMYRKVFRDGDTPTLTPLHALMIACQAFRHQAVPPLLSQSSQLFSTVSFTRFVYSLRLSLYRLEASTLAGEEVLGSFSRL